jgi:hypothetical protein
MPDELASYSGAYRRTPRHILRPRSVDELIAAVRDHAIDARGKITVRANGNSLHNQALGGDTVLVLTELPHRIVVRANDDVPAVAGSASPIAAWGTVEVSGWTPWDAIVRAGLREPAPARWYGAGGAGSWTVDRPLGDEPPATGNHCFWRAPAGTPLPRLLPYCLVSSGWITAGGSLSADGVWRMSKALGREADSVVWLELLRSNGSVVRLFNARWGGWEQRARFGAASWAASRAENDAWFAAAVGGYGLVGIIVRIKYRLLELGAEAVDSSAFERAIGLEPRTTPAGAGARSLPEQLLGRISEVAAAVVRRLIPVAWPAFPHSSADTIGSVGEELPVRVLTWLRPARDLEDLWNVLTAPTTAASSSGTGPDLPRVADASTWAPFALIFTNHRSGLRAVLGHLAFGRAPASALPFPVWDRRYGWLNAALLGWTRAVPALARIGESLVYRNVFAQRFAAPASANSLVEFGFFFEGHAIAQTGLPVQLRSLQQSWVLPIERSPDGSTAAAQARFLAFAGALLALAGRSRSSGRALRFQLCDVKYVPAGSSVLCSAGDTPALMITVTLENGRAYERRGWGLGDPQAELAELSAAFAPRGVKVHLTKSVHADRATLRASYGDALREFERRRRQLDPRGLWGSDFARLLGLP